LKEAITIFCGNFLKGFTLRIGNVIKYWMDNHFEDFDENDQLLGHIDKFLNENQNVKGYNNIFTTLKKMLEKKVLNTDL